jgi:hypothetical protein
MAKAYRPTTVVVLVTLHLSAVLQLVGLEPFLAMRIQSGGAKVLVGVVSVELLVDALAMRRCLFHRAIGMEKPLAEALVVDEGTAQQVASG